MKTVDTFTAQIAVGFKNIDTGDYLTVEMARKICQDYCNAVGLCVTLMETVSRFRVPNTLFAESQRR